MENQLGISSQRAPSKFSEINTIVPCNESKVMAVQRCFLFNPACMHIGQLNYLIFLSFFLLTSRHTTSMMIVTFKITSTKVAPPTAAPTMAPVFPALTGIATDIASSICWGEVVDIICVVSVVAVVCLCVCTENNYILIKLMYRRLKVLALNRDLRVLFICDVTV